MFGRIMWPPLGPMDSWPPFWAPTFVRLPDWTLRADLVRGVWTLDANPHGWPPTPQCWIAPVGGVDIELIVLCWDRSDPKCPATPCLSVSRTLPVHPAPPSHPHATACDTPALQMSERAAHTRQVRRVQPHRAHAGLQPCAARKSTLHIAGWGGLRRRRRAVSGGGPFRARWCSARTASVARLLE